MPLWRMKESGIWEGDDRGAKKERAGEGTVKDLLKLDRRAGGGQAGMVFGPTG